MILRLVGSFPARHPHRRGQDHMPVTDKSGDGGGFFVRHRGDCAPAEHCGDFWQLWMNPEHAFFEFSVVFQGKTILVRIML